MRAKELVGKILIVNKIHQYIISGDANGVFASHHKEMDIVYQCRPDMNITKELIAGWLGINKVDSLDYASEYRIVYHTMYAVPMIKRFKEITEKEAFCYNGEWHRKRQFENRWVAVRNNDFAIITIDDNEEVGCG